jgi:hypothetical protein
MSERPTPETDAAWDKYIIHPYTYGAGDLRILAQKLERERDEARKQAAMWKANHDNQVSLKAMLMERPDLGDRASRIAQLIRERDEAREQLRIAVGLLSTQPQFANKHPEDVLDFVKEGAK